MEAILIVFESSWCTTGYDMIVAEFISKFFS